MTQPTADQRDEKETQRLRDENFWQWPRGECTG